MLWMAPFAAASLLEHTQNLEACLNPEQPAWNPLFEY